MSTAALLYLLGHLAASARQVAQLRVSAWQVLRALEHLLLPVGELRAPLLQVPPGADTEQQWALVSPTTVRLPSSHADRLRPKTAKLLLALERGAWAREAEQQHWAAAVGPGRQRRQALPMESAVAALPPASVSATVAAVLPAAADSPTVAAVLPVPGPASATVAAVLPVPAAVATVAAALPVPAASATVAATLPVPVGSAAPAPQASAGAPLTDRLSLASVLSSAFQADRKCCAQLVAFAARAMEGQLSQALSSRSGVASAVVHMPPLVSEGKKQRRVDARLLELTPAEARALNVVRVAKSLPAALSMRVAMQARDMFLLKYWNGGKELFRGLEVQSVCLALDASRVGQRDVMMIAMYNRQTDRAMWLPPQVLRELT